MAKESQRQCIKKRATIVQGAPAVSSLTSVFFNEVETREGPKVLSCSGNLQIFSINHPVLENLFFLFLRKKNSCGMNR